MPTKTAPPKPPASPRHKPIEVSSSEFAGRFGHWAFEAQSAPIRVVNNKTETNPQPISTFPLPPIEAFGKRGGRYGAHNLHENLPVEVSFRSDTIVVGTFFNGGVRVFDTSNPYQPQEIAYYVPATPRMAPSGAIQINDCYVDDRRLVFAADRHIGGVYVLEMNV